MHRGRRAFLLLLPLSLAGCGPEERPKGTGATGRLTAALPKQNIDAHLVNKLDASQQKRLEWLYQPFDKAVRLGPAKVSPEREKLLREKWDAVLLADVTGNKRYHYSAAFTTNLGTTTIGFADDYCPNHVRAFVVLAGLHYFDGKSFKLKDGFAVLETDPAAAEFTLAEEHYPGFHPNPGAIGNFIVDQRTISNSMAIIVQELPIEVGRTFNHFGGFTERMAARMITDIRETLKKKDGFVKIERVQISRQETPLFIGEDVALPQLTDSGKPSPERDREAATKGPAKPGR
jgi:hypothetical protein